MDLYLLFVIVKILVEGFCAMATDIFDVVCDTFDKYHAKAELSVVSDDALVHVYFPAVLDGFGFVLGMVETLTVVYQPQLILLGYCLRVVAFDLIWICVFLCIRRLVCSVYNNIALRINPTTRYRDLAYKTSGALAELKVAKQLESKRLIQYWSPRYQEYSREMSEFLVWYETSWFRLD